MLIHVDTISTSIYPIDGQENKTYIHDPTILTLLPLVQQRFASLVPGQDGQGGYHSQDFIRGNIIWLVVYLPL
jgi:hypothetical protein